MELISLRVQRRKVIPIPTRSNFWLRNSPPSKQCMWARLNKLPSLELKTANSTTCLSSTRARKISKANMNTDSYRSFNYSRRRTLIRRTTFKQCTVRTHTTRSCWKISGWGRTNFPPRHKWLQKRSSNIGYRKHKKGPTVTIPGIRMWETTLNFKNRTLGRRSKA